MLQRFHDNNLVLDSEKGPLEKGTLAQLSSECKQVGGELLEFGQLLREIPDFTVGIGYPSIGSYCIFGFG